MKARLQVTDGSGTFLPLRGAEAAARVNRRIIHRRLADSEPLVGAASVRCGGIIMTRVMRTPVPVTAVGVDKIEARFPRGTSEATKHLAVGDIGRTIASPHDATALIRQHGADPKIVPRLRQGSGEEGGLKSNGFAYSLLNLAIDNKSDNTVGSISAEGLPDGLPDQPVVLPQWPDGLQEGILTALIDGGADPTALKPLEVAIRFANEAAFDLLMARHDRLHDQPGSLHNQPGTDLRGSLMGLPEPLSPLASDQRPPPTHYLKVLMSTYQRLIQRDPTLATDGLLVHRAAFFAGGLYPQWFMDSYLDLIAQHGAEMTGFDSDTGTPLYVAAEHGSPEVADYLCRKLPADQIDRRGNHPAYTPLGRAAAGLDFHTSCEVMKKYFGAKIPNYKMTIRALLRAGADINSIHNPYDIQQHHRERRLVLLEYATVLKELPGAVMSAVNNALAPHRSLAALLIPRLAVGPHEAPIFGWRIASYLFDMAAAREAISEAIGVRHSVLARRVRAAVEHFVRSAVFRAISNREVVGRRESVGGVVVRVPLQCFAVADGADIRPPHVVHTAGRLGLREVVHKARRDEAALHGVEDVAKGFNEHLGDDDCQFAWWQLGWRIEGSSGGEFVLLGIS
ncbi:unnamed protein product [Vitrella brassicaformis CCMP3155]|uniref:Uncharacterized protein n=1 Tax=Vitrella brassicaformis (strain CCMP3155) TaxID=1169540 RepID=A0A0G4G836_VITBC|nr:unnamed protein product [Vitrella brassicaformis CCMP3155]|eukprot:CEM24673.1 unnamed protein product [Vitrella brassicaformis CCMP3155]